MPAERVTYVTKPSDAAPASTFVRGVAKAISSSFAIVVASPSVAIALCVRSFSAAPFSVCFNLRPHVYILK